MTESFSAVASRATADALEFPSLLALCAELAACDLGRDRILALRPVASAKEVQARQSLLHDAGRVLHQSALVASQEEPLLPLLVGLSHGEPQIGGREIVRLGGVLAVTARAKATIRSSEVEVPAAEELVSTLPDLEALRQRINRSLDQRGRVRDDASPQLSRLRRRVHRLRDGLYQQLQQTLSQQRKHFAADTVSLKDGRLTLLLHSGARGRVKGLVHGRSGTGQSLYFEPLAVMESNNQLQETLEEEEAERQRILVDLIGEAQEQLPAIEAHFELLGVLDLLQSLFRFAERSSSVFPEISTDGSLHLIGARHPLLDPQLAPLRQTALGLAGHRQPVVPLDLELDREDRILVITGPNAGGKTVALKTVGLLALAAQSGIPVPVAAGSRMPLFEAVMAMVGDEQDLLADRSTFSARLIRLKEAWELAGEASLVLLDELGSGTDPEEGSALAMALLEGLLDSGSMGVLTTHLTQLAAMALERPGAACAAMEFDSESGEPTYHLRPGAPGGSQALALGRRLGLPEAWLERAESLLGAEHRDLRNLLAEVETVRQQLAATQLEREREAQDLRKIRRRLEDELAATRDERRQLGRSLRSKIDEFRNEVVRRLRDEVEKARHEVKEGRQKRVVAGAVERLFEGAPEVESEEETGAELEEGSLVRHRSLGWTGKLRQIRGSKADVTVLGKRIRCNLDDLTGLRQPESSTPSPKPVVSLVRDPEGAEEVPLELNLVGVRVEPALERLDQYLDRALLTSHRQVRVVHGFGSGRLRKAVREHLGPHPAVRDFRPGRDNEGGDGATVVTLDKS